MMLSESWVVWEGLGWLIMSWGGWCGRWGVGVGWGGVGWSRVEWSGVEWSVQWQGGIGVEGSGAGWGGEESGLCGAAIGRQKGQEVRGIRLARFVEPCNPAGVWVVTIVCLAGVRTHQSRT